MTEQDTLFSVFLWGQNALQPMGEIGMDKMQEKDECGSFLFYVCVGWVVLGGTFGGSLMKHN